MNMTRHGEVRGACQHYDRCSDDLVSAKERVKEVSNELYRMRRVLEEKEKQLTTHIAWRDKVVASLDEARAGLLKAAR